MIDAVSRFLIITHLVRSNEVLSQVATVVEDTDWVGYDERGYRLLWAVARDWWLQYRTPPTYQWMVAGINKRLVDDPLYMTQAECTTMAQELQHIYALPADVLEPKAIIPVIQEFLDERRHLESARQLSTAAPGMDFSEKLESLRKEYAKTRLSTASKLDLFDPNGSFLIGSINKQPTNVNFIDVLLGGGTIPGDCVGILGPTGGGKTTTGVMLVSEVALAQRGAAYVSYENEIYPMISNRFYGYIGGIPKRAMEAAKRAEDLPEHYLRKLQEVRSKYDLNRYLNLIDMKKGAIGNTTSGPAAVEIELRRAADAGNPVEVVVIDQLLPLVDSWMARLNKGSELRRTYMQMAIEEFLNMARPDRMNCSFFILHQVRTEFQGKPPSWKPRKGSAAEDRSFDQWQQYCIQYGTRDEKGRCWASTVKAREEGEQDLIVQLCGDEYRIRYKPDAFVYTAGAGFVTRFDADHAYEVPRVGALDSGYRAKGNADKNLM